MFVCDNISTNEKGHLTFGSQDTVTLAEKYGTPLYLMDEDRIRKNVRDYSAAMKSAFNEGSGIQYAGKACCFRQLYRIMKEENCGIDVVSCGEIQTAFSAGYDMSKAVFHGNNKTDADIRFAIEKGVGIFVVDNDEELEALEDIASSMGKRQQIIIRITPGIDCHTYAAVNTGKVDSKFGNAIATGQAEKITSAALNKPHLKLIGFHCHIGSQVFAEDVYERGVEIMLEYMADIRKKYGFEAGYLNLGGGFGVRYVDTDPYIDKQQKISEIAEKAKSVCFRLNYPLPEVHLEPGRSIVADAGMTLYTVGSVKKIPGFKTYVSIDGGMTDNPRYALYKSSYTCLAANRMDEEKTMTASLVGRCCESGDIIQEGVPFPESMKRGDIVAVCTTGAYNYSMASVYNRIPRPPVVMLKEGISYTAVKRETYDDLTALDI